jgi:hypothetical protein
MERDTWKMSPKAKPVDLRSAKRDEATFSEVVQLIAASREKVRPDRQ